MLSEGQNTHILLLKPPYLSAFIFSRVHPVPNVSTHLDIGHGRTGRTLLRFDEPFLTQVAQQPTELDEAFVAQMSLPEFTNIMGLAWLRGRLDVHLVI